MFSVAAVSPHKEKNKFQEMILLSVASICSRSDFHPILPRKIQRDRIVYHCYLFLRHRIVLYDLFVL